MEKCRRQENALSAAQTEKLLDILRYLEKNNDYYREVFSKEHIDVYGEGPGILEKLPFIEKKDIRAGYSKYISNTPEEKIGELTSGSTGVPVNCLKTRRERTIAMLNIWKQRRAWDPGVSVENYMSLHDINTYRRVGNLLNFDREHMKKCFLRIMRLSPRWISGPVSTLERYARLIQNGEVDYKEGIIAFIELAGEFADESRREYIEKAFSCKTINHYGTMESWCIAYECPHGRLHVQEDLIYAEVINKGMLPADGDVGEIAITSLYNRLMPLIRYNVQDLGKVERTACKCGRVSAVITLYGGRTGDMIAGRREMPGEIFFKRGVYKLINRGIDCIDSFRVEQHGLESFVMYIVRAEGYNGEITHMLLDYIRNGLGKETRVEFRFVDDIPPLPSGKIKTFYSFVEKS